METLNWPEVCLFGAGHVGRAVSKALEDVPVKVHVIDSRSDQIEMDGTDAQKHVLAIPESFLTQPRSGAAYLIFTHDHGLDFTLASAALKRQDAAYVGLIGSRTKRARFESFYLSNGGLPEETRKSHMPDGGPGQQTASSQR